MPGPLVTIVTPSFNHGRFIRSTIESVLSQDYPHIEYIVMDGGSEDETARVVRDYGSRLRFVSEPDRGQSHAINKGFRMARGSILFWINSDDVILPGAVRHAVNGFAESPEAGAVYGEGYLMDEAGKITGRFPCTERFNLWKLVYVSDYILQQTTYFRRAALDDVGEVREDLHFALDWDLLIRIGKKFPLHYIPEYMGALREHGTAKSFAGGARRAREIAKLLREHTGRKVPPGATVYGLETSSRNWCSAVGRNLPRILAAPVEQLISMACGHAIGRALRAQGWYSDGWAAKRVRYMIPPGESGILAIDGWIPTSQFRNQRLVISAAGERIASREFFGGDFQWRVPLPDRAEPLDLEIRAGRSFIPALHAEGADRRRLSYILRSIGIESRGRGLADPPAATAPKRVYRLRRPISAKMTVMSQRPRLIIGITGATGAVFGIRLLEILKDSEIETHLVISKWGARTLAHETNYALEQVQQLASFSYSPGDQGAAISSGSFVTQGMIIAPCSMRTLAAIASGQGEHLVHRAADVILKERRKLVLAVRETPLNEIHLDNMAKLCRMGVAIMPPVPSFYNRPATLEEVIDHTAMRLLDQCGIHLDVAPRWSGEMKAGEMKPAEMTLVK